jgi:general secretion pathway protein F
VFRYKAVSPAGQTEEGEMDAAAESAVVVRLQEQGYLPIRIWRAGNPPLRPALTLTWRRRRKATGSEAEAFLRELATLLEAGLPLDQCLETLGEVAESEALRDVVAGVHDRVRNGAPLSAAMAESPVFSELHVNMVQAGEAAGSLAGTLARLADYLQRSSELRRSIVSALIYPSILVAVAGVSVVLLLVFVLPQFSEMFADLGAALPLSTRFVLATGELAQAYWWVAPVLVIVSAFVGRAWLAAPEHRMALDRRLLRVPLLGDLIGKAEIAKFTRTLGTMVGHGVPLLKALGIVEKSFANRVLAHAVAESRERLRGGSSLAAALADSGVFPKLAVKMIRVGEESGELEDMLMRLADVYERETRVTVQRFLNVIEPALIVGLGAVIAAIILAVLSAVLGMNELVI